jgi:hypothetical protein
MRINGNNFGQIIGCIKKIEKTVTKNDLEITTLTLEVRDKTKPTTNYVKIYNSPYGDELHVDQWIQCMTHIAQRTHKNAIYTDVVVDCIVFLPKN